MAEILKLPRFYPILDFATVYKCGIDPVRAAEVLIGAGAKILQLRNKDDWSPAAYAMAKQIRRLSAEAGVLFVVNDRADVALLLDAAIHVGQQDLPPSAVRMVTGDRFLGFSTHNEQQIRGASAEPVDYIALGPIFSTTSKDRPDPVLGIESLAAVRPLVPDKPLVAIGGVTRSNAAQLWSAGADSVAVVADLYPPSGSLADLRERAREWVSLSS